MNFNICELCSCWTILAICLDIFMAVLAVLFEHRPVSHVQNAHEPPLRDRDTSMGEMLKSTTRE
jgi:hypothetical protein